MALADLMKKGFLTSATATVATPATHGTRIHPTVATVAGVAVAKLQNSESSPIAEILTSFQFDLVREFMEVDGLTLVEAQALATVSVQPRPAGEWLALINELDWLIERYCVASGITGEAKDAILSTRYRQSLASIPESLEWFQRELARMVDAT